MGYRPLRRGLLQGVFKSKHVHRKCKYSYFCFSHVCRCCCVHKIQIHLKVLFLLGFNLVGDLWPRLWLHSDLGYVLALPPPTCGPASLDCSFHISKCFPELLGEVRLWVNHLVQCTAHIKALINISSGYCFLLNWHTLKHICHHNSIV